MSARWEARWYQNGSHWSDAPLRAVSWLYGLGVTTRNRFYDAGMRAVTRVPNARVVSVGNVHVGGMGKTPVVIFLAQWARASGKKVVVLSRGYGRTEEGEQRFDASKLPAWEQVGDEPRLIAQRCPGVQVWVGAHRAALAERAANELQCDFVLLDDGFQHRALSRDVDVVVWDREVGAGNGALLPRGPLREPLTALGRAHVLWTRGEGSKLPEAFNGTQVRAEHFAQSVLTPDGAEQPLSTLKGQKVVALAALARPGGFEKSLLRAGAQLCETRFFPDHHAFSGRELASANEAVRQHRAWLITTEKDAQRLPAQTAAYQLRLGVRVLEGLAPLAAALGLPESAAPLSPVRSDGPCELPGAVRQTPAT
ncbi:MAG: tetraacyldisaccharide 4'-kinase [Myxococcaceae bacterium]|nr:tetraacyldisaccharide 4'-kinase [Myxococcaceae bacterium]